VGLEQKLVEWLRIKSLHFRERPIVAFVKIARQGEFTLPFAFMMCRSCRPPGGAAQQPRS
jgi:hypothetical protein